MRLNSVPAIFRKEMLDTVRDRRTILSMIVVPLAAMPLMFFMVTKFIGFTEKKAGEEAVTIAVHGAGRLPGLLNALAGADFKFLDKADLKAAVERKEIAAGVEAAGTGEAIEVLVYTDSTRPASEKAAAMITAALDTLKATTIRLKLADLRVPERVLTPFTVKKENIASGRKMSGMFWGGLLGYFVVILMFSGGMYPAIDMTAGEKERRTLEVFLSSPAGRSEIVLAKILATTAAVCVTALLSIASLVFSFRYADFGKSAKELTRMAGNIPLDAHTVSLVLLALAPMAVLAASLMIAIALFAKSFKEAQSYLTPLVMAVVFPLVIGMMPGLQLTPVLALIPVFNVCQLIKEIFLRDYSATAFLVTMGANVLYAMIAFAAAVRVFNNERVLFRS